MTLIVRARSLRLLTRLNLDAMIFCRPLGDVFPIAVCCLEWISNLGTRLYKTEPVLRTLRTIDTSAPTVILLDSFFNLRHSNTAPCPSCRLTSSLLFSSISDGITISKDISMRRIGHEHLPSPEVVTVLLQNGKSRSCGDQAM